MTQYSFTKQAKPVEDDKEFVAFKAGWIHCMKSVESEENPDSPEEAYKRFKNIKEDKHQFKTGTSSISELLCPECGDKMISRNGKFGKFWGCKQYPSCKGTRDSNGQSKGERNAERVEDEPR